MCVNPLAIAGGFFCVLSFRTTTTHFRRTTTCWLSHEYVIGIIIKKTIFTTKKTADSFYTFFLPLIYQ